MLHGSPEGLQRKATATCTFSWGCSLPVQFVMVQHDAVVYNNTT